MATTAASYSATSIGSVTPGFSSSGAFQFRPPKSFSGKREEFEEWSWTLKAYLSLIHPSYSAKMNDAELRKDPLPEEFFKNPDGTYNQTVIQRQFA